MPTCTGRRARRCVRGPTPAILSVAVLEKVLLVAMVAVTFSQILPGLDVGSLDLAFGVALIVTLYDRYRVIGNLSKRESPHSRGGPSRREPGLTAPAPSRQRGSSASPAA